jgi:uncharacterized protein (DUF1697 family)
MPKYVAFLRAINVGGRIVKMDRLRTLFEELKFSNAETVIASGNVLFDSSSKSTKTLEKKIEKALQEALGYEVTTFVRSLADLAKVAEYKPFSDFDVEGITVYIGFLVDPPTEEAQKKVLAFHSEINEFHIHEREVYWLGRKGFSDSGISGNVLEKALGMPATFRNSTTVRKIADKYST